MLLPTQWRPFFRLNQSIKIPSCVPRFVYRPSYLLSLNNVKEHETGRLRSRRSAKKKDANSETCPCNNLPLSSWIFRVRMLSKALHEDDFHIKLLLLLHDDNFELFQNQEMTNAAFKQVNIANTLHQLARIPKLLLPPPLIDQGCSQRQSGALSTRQSFSITTENVAGVCEDKDPLAGYNKAGISIATRTSSGTGISSQYAPLVSDGGCTLVLQKEFLLQVLTYIQRMKCVYRLNRALESTISSCSSKAAGETCSIGVVSACQPPQRSNEHGTAHWPYGLEEARVVIELITWYKQRESMTLLALLYRQVHSQKISRRKDFARSISTDMEAALNALSPVTSSDGVKNTCLLWLLNRIVHLDNHDNEKLNSILITLEKRYQKWLSMCTDCVCAASFDDLFTADAISVRNRIQKLMSCAPKEVHATNTPHMPAFTDFASLFDTLPNSKSELSRTIGTESLMGSLIDRKEEPFWTEIMHIFKHDKIIYEVFEVLRRRLVDSDLNICPSLRVYWRCVLVEMLRSGWEAVEVLADTDRQHKREESQISHSQISHHSLKLRKSAEYYAIGVFLSFRRMLSAFSKHQLLKPLIELHELVTGYHCHTVHRENRITFKAITKDQKDINLHPTNTSNVSVNSEKLEHFREHASTVRQDILSGKIASPLLWRELVLFDAFTLINLGHTSEKASDLWDAVRQDGSHDAVRVASLSVLSEDHCDSVKEAERRPSKLRVQRLQQRLVYLQEECLRHLSILQTSSNSTKASMISSKKRQRATSVHGMDFIVSKITPKTRAKMISRLKEGLRLSTKVLLGLGDTGSICALYKNHGSSIGGSWEAGKALMQEGVYDTALVAFQQLLRDTHRQYPSGLPRFIQDMILEAITGVGYGIVSAPENEQKGEMEMVNTLMQRYEQLLSLSEGQLLPAPLCLHALLKGILKGTSSIVTATSPRCAYIGSCFLMEYVTRYGSRHGLLSTSIDEWIECVLGVQQAMAAESELFETLEQEFLRALVELLRVFQYLPITRISLTWFLRAGYRKGVHVVLYGLVTPRALCSVDISKLSLDERDSLATPSSSTQGYLSDSYIQATLNSLSPKTLNDLSEFLASNHITCAQTDFLHLHYEKMGKFEEERFAFLKDICATIAQYRVGLQSLKRPWQCFLCRTWNSRHSTVCKLCESLDTAVVQCARCGGFASTRDTACLVCEADFTVNNGIMTTETESGDGSNAAIAVVGDGRSADIVLHSNAFKAVFPLRTWTCQDCGHANDARHIFYCAFCSSQNSSLHKTLTETSYMCPTCERVNPQGILRPWCSTCGTLSPVIPKDKEKSLWYCSACRHLNPWLLVHCEHCTEGRPLPASVPGDAVLSSFPSFADNNTSLMLAPSPFIAVIWDTMRCHECRVVNPLVAKFCRGCGCTLTFPSKVRETIDSGLLEWMRRAFVHHPNHESCDKGNNKILVEEEVRVPTATDSITCSYCGCTQQNSISTASLDHFSCRHCHACFPGSTVKLWVCLQLKCFHVNAEWDSNIKAVSKRFARECMNNGDLKSKTEEPTFYLCSACHTSHHSVDTFHLYLQTPAVVPYPHLSPSPIYFPIKKGESGVYNPLGYRRELSNMRTTTALLCLPPVSGPTQCCVRCGTYLEYTNLAGVCPQCGLCQSFDFVHEADQLERGGSKQDLLSHISPTRTILSGWLILFRLSQAVSAILFHEDSGDATERGAPDEQESGKHRKEFPSRTDPMWILDFLKSAINVLRSTQEDLLPWRGCDLQNRMHCGVEARVVVLDDQTESVHSAILLVRYIIRDLCLVARSFIRNEGIRTSVFSKCLESDAVWEKQRPWLLAAGDLVDIVNATTDFDEIGFPLLAKLCQLIRPHEVEHIQSVTRWTYLHAMKLTREAMVHEVVCVKCFGRHKKDELCCL